MDDLLPEVEAAMRKVCAAMADAVRRYACVSGIDVGHDLTECFITSFVLDRLGDEYAMTLETNARKLLARDMELRGRHAPPSDGRVAALSEEIHELDTSGRVDMVLYRDDGGERHRRPFLALVEFKLWDGWAGDRVKLLRIVRLLDTCPFGAMCFVAQGACDTGWLGKEGEVASASGDIWSVEEMPDVLHKGYPLSIGTQIVRRPIASG